MKHLYPDATLIPVLFKPLSAMVTLLQTIGQDSVGLAHNSFSFPVDHAKYWIAWFRWLATSSPRPHRRALVIGCILSLGILLITGTSKAQNFGAQTTYPVGTWPNRVTCKDVNGDGKADLITANTTSNTVSILLNRAALCVRLKEPYLDEKCTQKRRFHTPTPSMRQD